MFRFVHMVSESETNCHSYLCVANALYMTNYDYILVVGFMSVSTPCETVDRLTIGKRNNKLATLKYSQRQRSTPGSDDSLYLFGKTTKTPWISWKAIVFNMEICFSISSTPNIGFSSWVPLHTCRADTVWQVPCFILGLGYSHTFWVPTSLGRAQS